MPLSVVQWSSWEVASGAEPSDLVQLEFWPLTNVEPAPAAEGPMINVAGVAAWRALVVAHRYANDEHIRVMRASHPLLPPPPPPPPTAPAAIAFLPVLGHSIGVSVKTYDVTAWDGTKDLQIVPTP